MTEPYVPTQDEVNFQFASLFERSSLQEAQLAVISNEIVVALHGFAKPEFKESPDEVGEMFVALFDEGNIEGWLMWLEMRLKLESQGAITLSSANSSDYRAATSGAIKGQHITKVMTDKSKSRSQLLIFGPYSEPVETYSLTEL
jgi:hypothetical protein